MSSSRRSGQPFRPNSSLDEDIAAGEDLTTRARIRNAAISRFAGDGMAAPLRAVAEDAGVSPGLIVHHFGSRAGLRKACDDYVLARIRQDRSRALGGADPGGALLAQLALIEGYAPLIGYVLRLLQEGGPQLDVFVDQSVADAIGYLYQAEEAGTVRPSRDPEARARVLVEMSLGALLLQLPARQESLALAELPRWLRTYSERIMLPLLELYTEPLLTDATLLGTYLSADRTGPSQPDTG